MPQNMDILMINLNFEEKTLILLLIFGGYTVNVKSYINLLYNVSVNPL